MAEVTIDRFLPQRRIPDTDACVILRHLRAATLGALLALTAVLGLATLTTWHDASFHDDDRTVQLSVDAHDHDQGPSQDTDSPMHLVAHAAGHWLNVGLQNDRLVTVLPSVRLCVIGHVQALAGLSPGLLLRPPRG